MVGHDEDSSNLLFFSLKETALEIRNGIGNKYD